MIMYQYYITTSEMLILKSKMKNMFSIFRDLKFESINSLKFFMSLVILVCLWYATQPQPLPSVAAVDFDKATDSMILLKEKEIQVLITKLNEINSSIFAIQKANIELENKLKNLQPPEQETETVVQTSKKAQTKVQKTTDTEPDYVPYTTNTEMQVVQTEKLSEKLKAIHDNWDTPFSAPGTKDAEYERKKKVVLEKLKSLWN